MRSQIVQVERPLLYFEMYRTDNKLKFEFISFNLRFPFEGVKLKPYYKLGLTRLTT